MYSLGCGFKGNEKELILVGYHGIYINCGNFKDNNNELHDFYFDELTPGDNNDENSSDSKQQ
jgi:hypothetical protein